MIDNFADSAAAQCFAAFVEREAFAREKAFLESLGCKALLTSQNCSDDQAMAALRETFDYVDNHCYLDHPKFLGKLWSARPRRLFDLSVDPVNLASERAVMCLFLRGDMAPLETRIALDVGAPHLTPDGKPAANRPEWMDEAWRLQVGRVAGERPLFTNDNCHNCSQIANIHSAPQDTPDFVLDREAGCVIVATPRHWQNRQMRFCIQPSVLLGLTRNDKELAPRPSAWYLPAMQGTLMKELRYSVDFCVVGGGLAGMAAALAAARHGASVALVQDRPVLGGNASSEVRMHVCGAHGPNRRETGIVEELFLDNFRYNTRPTYTGWDAVLYGKVQYQKGVTLLLNASVCDAAMDGPRIRSVRAWQTTTQRWITVEAKLFADCSGDAVLAPLSGADFRMGREGRAEHGESIAPLVPDTRTMGMSCLFQAREYPEPQPFVPLPWANLYTDASQLPHRWMDVFRTNFWWIELGGMVDSIADTETCREELLRIAYGVWNYLKNHAPDRDRYANLALDWVGFLPGKRESRRYYGDHILTQHDVEAGGRFPDTVAYGGWSMDDHFPEGFYSKRHEGTIYHPAPSPYGIPYRSLYSRNIENLFCAGRDISATHSALSSTRVMATCALMGQAVGTAAAIAARDGLSPRGVYERRLAELQQTLMDDDCWLPGFRRGIPSVCSAALLRAGAGNPAPLRNGMDRPDDASDNAWAAPVGTPVEYVFPAPAALTEARLVFDSDLDRTDPSRADGQKKLLNMRYYVGLADAPFAPPATLVRDFRLETLDAAGEWTVAARVTDNHQRLARVALSARCRGLRLVVERTWGCAGPRVFAFDCR